MNIIFHKGLSEKSWFSQSIFNQMANIGSEVFRFLKWRKKSKKDSQLAFERALELFDLTMADPKNKVRLKEIARTREVLVDFDYTNIYSSTEDDFMNYFYAFNYAARLKV